MYFAYDLHITTRESEETSCQLHPVLARRLITGEVDSPSHSDRQTPSDTTSVLLPFLSGEFAIPSDTPSVLLSLSGEFVISSDIPSVPLPF